MNDNVEHWRTTRACASDTHGMVAAQHHLAARAGASQLYDGGNAIDAGIAAALALGAVEPWMCGLGGSGLMLIWLARERRAVLLDFQGVLPARIDCTQYSLDTSRPETLMGFPGVQDDANVRGYRSIAVPGAAAGFDHALTRFGSRLMQQVAAPAIALARRGLAIDWHAHLNISLAMSVLRHDPASAGLYLPEGCPAVLEKGLSQQALADTLQSYATGGAESFYRGELAAHLASELAIGGSLIHADDLADYQVLESDAVTLQHRGHEVHAGGQSTGGQRLHDFLRISLDVMAELGEGSAPTPERWMAYANALEQAWQRHLAYIGRETEQGSCTSHLSAVDSEGNMVALTHTLLNRFGSGVTLPKTGLLMNNAVSYFDPRPGYPTSMRGGQRINASNMCPTIVTREGRAVLAVGASGGNQIMPAVAQIVALMLDEGLSLEQAMHWPRIDASWRGSLRVDPALGKAVLDRLAEHHELEVAQRLVYPKLYACVSAVACTDDDVRLGMTDPSQPVADASGPAPFPELVPLLDVHGVRA